MGDVAGSKTELCILARPYKYMDVSFTSGKISPGDVVLKLISIKMSI